MSLTNSTSDINRDVGLVLEGGGLRGVFTAGVLDFFLENKIQTSYAVGSSSGACNLLCYLSGQAGHARDTMIRRDGFKRYYGLNQLVRNQRIINLDRIFYEDPYHDNPFDFDALFSSRTRFEIVVTNCASGSAEYMTEHCNQKRLATIAKASSSMPLFTKTVYMEGGEYLSGSVADPVPINHAIMSGSRKNIVILTRKQGHYPQMTTYQKPLYELAYRKYPALLQVMLRRHELYMRQMQLLSSEEAAGRAFVLRPTIPEIRRLETDYDVLMNYYSHGYETAKQHRNELFAFLGI